MATPYAAEASFRSVFSAHPPEKEGKRKRGSNGCSQVRGLSSLLSSYMEELQSPTEERNLLLAVTGGGSPGAQECVGSPGISMEAIAFLC